MTIAESIARVWIGGQTPVRGEGSAVIRDGLARYLAVLFIEKQFGRDAAEAELMRERMAQAVVAKRDAPLSRTTPLDDTYFSSLPNKGAMFWRLICSSVISLTLCIDSTTPLLSPASARIFCVVYARSVAFLVFCTDSALG